MRFKFKHKFYFLCGEMGNNLNIAPSKYEKTSYYMVPESPWDHLEVSKEPPPFSPFTITTELLFKTIKMEKTDEQRVKLANDIIKAIKNYQFFIVELSENEVKTNSYIHC